MLKTTQATCSNKLYNDNNYNNNNIDVNDNEFSNNETKIIEIVERVTYLSLCRSLLFIAVVSKVKRGEYLSIEAFIKCNYKHIKNIYAMNAIQHKTERERQHTPTRSILSCLYCQYKKYYPNTTITKITTKMENKT